MRSSVIIPTYKPGDYLWDCLDSLCNQTLSFVDYEVVLVLNGPKEPYNSMIVDYLNSHSYIRWNYIYTEVKGVSNARNLGIESAKGDYLTFIDDDDYVSCQYLEQLLKNVSSTTVSLCYPLAFDDNDKNSIRPYHITATYEKLSNYKTVSVYKARSFFSGPVYKMIHKDIINQNRYDIRFSNGEDSLFMFLISCNIKNVVFSNKEAIYYRRFRRNSASMSVRSLQNHLYYNGMQLLMYTKYFLCKPFVYDFFFFVSRCGGCIFDIIDSIVKSIKNKK